MKTLVLYYSEGGATEEIAKKFAQEFQADIERIDTAMPYPEGEALIEQGQKEAETGFTPELKPLSHNISDYDVIVIGTPTWWYTMAPAILSLLRQNSFAGKTVLPFSTHVGQAGHVIPDMRKELKGAMVFSGLRLEFDKYKKLTPMSENEMVQWVEAVKKELLK